MQVEETEVFISLVPLCPSGCRSPAGRRNGRPARKPANNPRRTVSAEEEDEEEDEDEEDEDEEEEEEEASPAPYTHITQARTLTVMHTPRKAAVPRRKVGEERSSMDRLSAAATIEPQAAKLARPIAGWVGVRGVVWGSGLEKMAGGRV